MTARKIIRAKLNQLRRQSHKTGQIKVSASALVLWIRAGIHLLLAAVLSGATIFQNSAPFGVAMVGASGSGLCGGTALVGACFGYLTTLDFSSGLRYASASILTFAVCFAFYDWKPLRRSWVMPGIAAALNTFTGFITQSQTGWRSTDVIYFTLETALTAAAVWAFRQALTPMGRASEDRLSAPASRAGILALLCAGLLSRAPLYLYKDISLGRILAVTAVLASAWQGGIATGAIVGVSVGLSMDLAAQGIPLSAGLHDGLVHPLAGLGVQRGHGKRAAGFQGVHVGRKRVQRPVAFLPHRQHMRRHAHPLPAQAFQRHRPGKGVGQGEAAAVMPAAVKVVMPGAAHPGRIVRVPRAGTIRQKRIVRGMGVGVFKHGAQRLPGSDAMLEAAEHARLVGFAPRRGNGAARGRAAAQVGANGFHVQAQAGRQAVQYHAHRRAVAFSENLHAQQPTDSAAHRAIPPSCR